MTDLQNPKDFEKWLEDKPAEWAGPLALRCALRVLPIALDPSSYKKTPPSSLILAILWTTSILCAARWSTSRKSAYGHRIPVEVVNVAARTFSNAATDAAYAAANAGQVVYATANTPKGAPRFAANAAADSASSAARTADAGDILSAVLWQSLTKDCEALITATGNGFTQARSLMKQPLWGKEAIPATMIQIWKRASRYLRANSLQIWEQYYLRRLHGGPQGFGLPKERDLEIQDRLLDQHDDWWKRGLGPVTKDIEAWIADLQPSKADEIASALAVNNPETLYYVETESDTLTVDFDAKADLLTSDQASVMRYEEVKRLTVLLNQKCESADFGNMPSDVKTDGELLLDSLGETIDQMQPDLFISRFHGLAIDLAVQEAIAKRQDDRNDPWPDAVLPAVKKLVPAARQYIRLDGFLAVLDDVSVGRKIEVYDNSGGKKAVSDADQAGLIEPPVKPAIEEVTKNAPETPDPENVESKREAMEHQHFARMMMSKAIHHAGNVIKNAKGIETVGSWFKWVWKNKNWLQQRFAESPEILDWIKRIADSFSKSS